MELIDVVNEIVKISKQHRFVNAVYVGDIYENMNTVDVKYPNINLTINNIGEDLELGVRSYSLTMFYTDLQTSNSECVLPIQSVGVKVLGDICRKIDETVDWNVENLTFTIFTEKFKDLCSGCYVEFTLNVPIDAYCSDDDMFHP